jgi:hypothetical protein
MKTIQSTLRLFALLAVLLWSCQSEAQRQRLQNVSPEKIAQKQTEMQTRKLELNKEQASKLKAINMKYTQQMQGEMKKRRQNQKASFEQLKELNASQNEEVKAILSEEQYKKYLTLKKQNRAKMRARVSERRKENKEMRQNRVAELDLSDEQKEQFKSIKMKYREKMTEVKQKGRSDGNREEMRKLTDAMDEEVKQILSEEQFQTYLELKSERQEMKKSKMRKSKMKKMKN